MKTQTLTGVSLSPHGTIRQLLRAAALLLAIIQTSLCAIAASVTLSPCNNVEQAIAAAQINLGSAGGTINALAGNYTNSGGPVQLQANIILKGAGIDLTFFKLTTTGASVRFDATGASNSTISDITFDGGRTVGSNPPPGNFTHYLSTDNLNKLLIERCKFKLVWGYAIYIGSNVTNLAVQDSEFDSNDRSIGMAQESGSHDLIVRRNHFYGPLGSQTTICSIDNPDRTYAVQSIKMLFEYNKIENWRYGFTFTRVGDITIRENTIVGSAYSPTNYGQCIHLEDHCFNVLIQHNDMEKNNDPVSTCISMEQSCHDITIKNNLIAAKGCDAIKASPYTGTPADPVGCKNVEILNNWFMNTSQILRFWGSQPATTIDGNWIMDRAAYVSPYTCDILFKGTGLTLTNNIFPSPMTSSIDPGNTVVGNITLATYQSQHGGSNPPVWVPIQPVFAIWQAQKFSAAERANLAVSGPTADPDGDGVANLLEYAFGFEPKTANTTAQPLVGTVKVNSVDHLTLTYRRLVPTSPDLIYTPQSTSDLAGAWDTTPVLLSGRNNGDGTETVAYRDVTPLSGATKRFLRLKLTQQP
jgi:hypothetical protein